MLKNLLKYNLEEQTHSRLTFKVGTDNSFICHGKHFGHNLVHARNNHAMTELHWIQTYRETTAFMFDLSDVADLESRPCD